MIKMLCSAILLTGMVACSNKGDENPEKSVAQNTSAEKKESSVELSKEDQDKSAENKESSVEETKLSIEDTLSKEDQEIVEGLFNSVPKLKTFFQLEEKYSKSLTVKVIKPNSTNKNEEGYYDVTFEGTILEQWKFYVNPDSKKVLFKELSIGSKDYTLEEFNTYLKEIDEMKIENFHKMLEMKYGNPKTQ
ncbi:hypothetical protein DT250_28650 [Bacillus sp. AR2-1]|uniref:hypothetical protein n=1 Tax=Bacillus cereus group TaxID=86661 RepID=UPI0011ED1167|nr:hypothetical protein [Bacillus sp. AR2-1]KAA0758989.1 hypothetical protein DT250_28650 [Bacillus sp. AR2-1]